MTARMAVEHTEICVAHHTNKTRDPETIVQLVERLSQSPELYKPGMVGHASIIFQECPLFFCFLGGLRENGLQTGWYC